MFRLLWHHSVRQWARSLALLTGILVAVSSFVVLTATTESSKLTVTGTVAENRGAYDVLVRPGKAVQDLEKAEGLIRPNSLSDIYGGITFDQLDAVRRAPGTDIAAPLAMLGHQREQGGVYIDLAKLVPKGTRGTFDLDRVWEYDGGLSSVVQKRRTVFITPYHLEVRPGALVQGESPDGTTHDIRGSRYFEVLPSGERREVCKGGLVAEEHATMLRPAVDCLSWSGYTDLKPVVGDGKHGPDTGLYIQFPRSQLIAGIDPEAEARLFGLDEAVTQGRYLSPKAPTTLTARPNEQPTMSVPALRSARGAKDLRLSTVLTPRGEDRPLLRKRYEVGTLKPHQPTEKAALDSLYPQPTTPVTYDRAADGTLRPRTVERPENVETVLPLDGRDTWFRELRPPSEEQSWGVPVPRIVGTFDPERLPEHDAASRVPLGTYGEPALSGADERSRKLLDGKPLRPASSPTSYIQQPPSTLVSIETVRWLADNNHLTYQQNLAPISAIRVRVAGVTGADEVSRERVRVTAEEIRNRTGLHVDIVLGSSPVAQTVVLPAGENGRPELRLTEWWSKKNVATQIINASDTKSLILLTLVLVVCTLFVANAAAAAVRTRRGELGLLAAVGWQRPHLFTIVLGELLLLGAVAGLLGTGVAWGAGHLLGIDVPPGRALLAVPVALAVAALSGAVPAWLAARVHPVTALRPAVTTGRRTRMFAGITGMALAGAARARGRTLLGITAVATAAAATLLLIAATTTFRGTLAGSLLGETISLQVRTTDIAAVATMIVLSTIAVGDVIYLGVQDRAAEFALLRAVGWHERTTIQLVLLEGAFIGLLGSLTGTLLGAGAALWLAPADATGALLPPAAGVITAGTALSALASLVPVLIQRRRSTARLLAEAA
ncbi:FtsX-like permease family protein [Streptomyces sp. NPDC049906]|uniref:FtsX-like permease family protein n=1 Tax=Streptomyces sp. NPDC049906 TaxID=3155656 RepID=UPI00341D5F8F